MGQRMMLEKGNFSGFHALPTEVLCKATWFWLREHVLRLKGTVLWCSAIWKATSGEMGPVRTQDRAVAKNNDLRWKLGQAGNYPHAWMKLDSELGNQTTGLGRGQMRVRAGNEKRWYTSRRHFSPPAHCLSGVCSWGKAHSVMLGIWGRTSWQPGVLVRCPKLNVGIYHILWQGTSH